MAYFTSVIAVITRFFEYNFIVIFSRDTAFFCTILKFETMNAKFLRKILNDHGISYIICENGDTLAETTVLNFSSGVAKEETIIENVTHLTIGQLKTWLGY